MKANARCADQHVARKCGSHIWEVRDAPGWGGVGLGGKLKGVGYDWVKSGKHVDCDYSAGSRAYI